MSLINFALKLILNSWRENFKLVAFAVLSVSLGVALVLSVFNANESILEQFDYSNSLIQGKQTAQIQSIDGSLIDESSLPEEFLENIKNLEYTPVLELTAYDENSKRAIKILGVDLLNDYQFRNYAFNRENPPIKDLLNAKQGGLIVSEKTKEKMLWKGKQTNLFYGSKKVNLIINDSVYLKELGLVKAEDGLVAIADINYLRNSFDEINKLSSIQFRKNDLKEIKSRFSLPKGLAIISPSNRKEEIKQLTEAFRFNLQALSFVALLVAGYLISQTIFISLQRKTKILGIIRVLGLSKTQAFLLITFESLLIGILGVALGSIIGAVLSKELLKALSATVNDLYFSVKASELILSQKGFIIASCVGISSCMLAAIPSCLTALSVEPAINLRTTSFKNFKNVSGQFLLTIFTFALVTIFLMLGFQDYLYKIPNRYIGFAMALLALGALSLIAGLFLSGFVVIFSKLQNWFSQLFSIRLSANFIRLWIATGALICGLSMTISISLMIDSFRDTVKDWIQDTLQGDLYISSLYKGGQGINPKLIEITTQWPEVRELDFLSKHQTKFDSLPVTIGGANLASQIKHLKFIEQVPELEEKVINQNNFILVSNTFAVKHQLKAGDQINLATKLGAVKMKIAAIYQDYSSEHGYILMKRDIYTNFYNNQVISNLALYLKDKSQIAEIKSRLMQIDQNEINTNVLKIQSNRELKKTILKIFDQTFHISYLFFWIALFISVVTVSLTLLSCIEENKYLNQISYYLGTSNKQIFSLEITQGLLTTLIAIILSLPGGFWLSEILKNTINNHSFGWIIYLHPNWLNIFSICGLALIGALLGSLIQLKQSSSKKRLSSLV